MPTLNTSVSERVKKRNETADDCTGGAIESVIHTFGAIFTMSLLSKCTGVAVTSDINTRNTYELYGYSWRRLEGRTKVPVHYQVNLKSNLGGDFSFKEK